MSTYCTACNGKIYDHEVCYAFDEPYCSDCFNERHEYCSVCDNVIMRTDANYNSEGTAYCDNCWESEFDDACPNNPEVFDEDRKLILSLSRAFLEGKVETRRLISINKKDLLLGPIRSKIGLVQNPIHLFGLKDREDYQISASANILEDVKEFALLHLSDCSVIEGLGNNRLGLSLTLRQNHQAEVIDLIKSLTCVRETVPA